MPLLIPNPILNPTSSSRTQRDIHTRDGSHVSEKPEECQKKPSSLARATGLIWLFVFMAMEPNSAFSDQPNFDSHSNQDVLNFSNHRATKKKKPTPPGEPAPPPPPGGRRHSGNPNSPPSLLLLAHQLRTSDRVGTKYFGITSGFQFTKPFPSIPQETSQSSSVIPAPGSIFLLVLAAHHRRRRMTYGGRPNHGRFHHHFVRSPSGPNDQSRDIAGINRCLVCSI